MFLPVLFFVFVMPLLRSRRAVAAASCPCPLCKSVCAPLEDEFIQYLNKFDLLKDAGLAPSGVFYCGSCVFGHGTPLLFTEAYWTFVQRHRAPNGSDVSCNLLKEDLFVLQDPQLAYLRYWWDCAQLGAVVSDGFKYIRHVGVGVDQIHLTPIRYQHCTQSLQVPYPSTDGWWSSSTRGLCPTGTFSGWARYL